MSKHFQKTKPYFSNKFFLLNKEIYYKHCCMWNLRSIWDENKENIAKRIVKRDVRKTELLQFVLRMMEEIA